MNADGTIITELNLSHNQWQVYNAVVRDFSWKFFDLFGDRGTGKSYVLAISAIALCLKEVGHTVIISSHKATEAKSLLKTIVKVCKENKQINNYIDWELTCPTRLRFTAGSQIVIVSIDENHEMEGQCGDTGIIFMRDLPDVSYRKKFLPSFGRSELPRVIRVNLACNTSIRMKL